MMELEQGNIYALIAIASLIGALLCSKLWVRATQGNWMGSEIFGPYLRMLVGFLLAAAVVFGYRAIFM